MVVPDWPTNIAYHTHDAAPRRPPSTTRTTVRRAVPVLARSNQTYAQILDHEATWPWRTSCAGSIYTHTFHIGNLRDYSTGKSLVIDWLDAVMAKYSALLQRAAAQPGVGRPRPPTSSGRNGHFAELPPGVNAVYDRAANTIKVTVAGRRPSSPPTPRHRGDRRTAPTTARTVTLTAGVPVTVAGERAAVKVTLVSRKAPTRSPWAGSACGATSSSGAAGLPVGHGGADRGRQERPVWELPAQPGPGHLDPAVEERRRYRRPRAGAGRGVRRRVRAFPADVLTPRRHRAAGSAEFLSALEWLYGFARDGGDLGRRAHRQRVAAASSWTPGTGTGPTGSPWPTRSRRPA